MIAVTRCRCGGPLRDGVCRRCAPEKAVQPPAEKAERPSLRIEPDSVVLPHGLPCEVCGSRLTDGKCARCNQAEPASSLCHCGAPKDHPGVCRSEDRRALEASGQRICSSCGTRPARPGRAKCNRCGQLCRESARKYAEARKQPDSVNHPAHYTSNPSGIECIEVAEHMNFCRGNALKYLWRAGLKGDALEDLKKAAWYLNREIRRMLKAAAAE